MLRKCGHQNFEKYARLHSDLGPTTITIEAMKPTVWQVLCPYRPLKSLQTGASVDNADDTAARSSSICIFSPTELIKKKYLSPNIAVLSQQFLWTLLTDKQLELRLTVRHTSPNVSPLAQIECEFNTMSAYVWVNNWTVWRHQSLVSCL
jgi:hypothetical protein